VAADRRQAGGIDPPYLYPDYRSTVLRAPQRPPLEVPYGLTELGGPPLSALLDGRARLQAADLTRQHQGEPLGQRILVHGRVLDGDGGPIGGTLVEIWQANAAGRYRHQADQHPAPLDPNFTGLGRCITDDEGRYRFVTIKPGAYPWRNHPNAWRPAHIHFSLVGRAFPQRLVTQMYFAGDPLFSQDPIFNSIPDPGVRQRLISRFDVESTVPEWALAFEFDIVLGGRDVTPLDEDDT